MTGASAAQRVVLAVEEAGVSEFLVAFAMSLCDLQHLPLLAQLRLEPGLDAAAELSFVSLVDRSGVSWREWTPIEAGKTRKRLFNRWQERLRVLSAGRELRAELEARKYSRNEQLVALIAGGDFLVVSSSRAVTTFEPTTGRVIVLNVPAATGVTEIAREVCQNLGVALECWSAPTLDELIARLDTNLGSGITLVLARAALVGGDVQMLCTFLRERGRGLVIVP